MKKAERVRAMHALCDELRRRGGVPWRSAVIQGERKEFFRGKDLQRWVEAHPNKLDKVVGEKSTDTAVDDFVMMLLHHQVVFATDRFYKKPHPRRKYLVKFPRKLTPRPRQSQRWDPDAFYCWFEDRPMPPWQIALSVVMAIVVLALCLFPLAPYSVRLSVVYGCCGLLIFIFGLILIRFCLFMIVFTLSGYEFWLFPNLLSDQVDVMGAFVPFTSFAKPADGKSHWGARIGGGAGTVFLFYALYAYAPDEKSIPPISDSIMDLWQTIQNPSIGDGSGIGSGYQPPPVIGNSNPDLLDPHRMQQERIRERLREKEERAKQKAREAEELAEAEAEAQEQEDADAEQARERVAEDAADETNRDREAAAGDDAGACEADGSCANPSADGTPEAGNVEEAAGDRASDAGAEATNDQDVQQDDVDEGSSANGEEPAQSAEGGTTGSNKNEL